MTTRLCPECDTRTPAEICPKCGTRTFLDAPSDVGIDPLLGRVFDNRYRIEALAKGRQALKDVMARWPGSIRVTSAVQAAPAPVVLPPAVVVKTPAAPSAPASAANDLSGRVDVNEKKGLSTTAWVLIGSGAAAAVAGGIAAAVLLARGSGGSDGPADVTWTVR